MNPSTERIADRLAGQEILVTGATGFLAKVFVEKLMRAVPKIGRIHLVIRPRSDGTSAALRARKEVFGSNAFDRLRAAWGPAFDERCREKVNVVSGDLTLTRFGLSEDAYAALAERVTLVVHSAATVTFDERLDWALALNIDGCRRLLRFAKDCGNAPLMQVSTAYVGGVQTGDVPEELIPEGHTVASYLAARSASADGEIPAGTFDPEEMVDLLNRLVAEVKERFAGDSSACRRELIDLGMRLAQEHGWHDTYTFTKWLAERVVNRDRDEVPLVIFRPAIIEGSYEEPAPGWIDGLRMADPLILAYGRGKLKEFPGDADVCVDLIPVDFVANAMIATLPAGKRGRSLEIYHCGSGARNPANMEDIVEAVEQAFRRRPMRDESGRPVRVSRLELIKKQQFIDRWQGRLSRVRRIRRILKTTQLAPRYRRRLAATEARIAQLIYFVRIYSPYTHLRSRFLDDRLYRVHQAMHPLDREEFHFDAARIDWHDYLVHRHVPGVRHFVLGSGTELEAPMLAASYAVEDESPDAPPPMQVLSALRGESLFDVFENAADAYPKRIALQVRRNGRWIRYTYRDALATTAAIARRFVEYGLRPGDHVAICSENRPEWGLTYLAAMRQGLTVVPIDSQLPAEEVVAQSRYADVKLICAGRTTVARIRTELEKGPSDESINLVELNPTFVPPPGTSRDPGPEPATVTGDHIASIVFTSGTTVAPKAVMLRHRNFLSNARSLVHVQPVRTDDQFLSVLPLHHVFEFTGGFLVPLANASTVTYVEQLTGAEISSLMRATGTTVMMVVPRLLKLFYDGIERKVSESGRLARSLFRLMGWLSDRTSGKAGAFLFDRVHRQFGGRLRLFVSGGSALPVSLYHSFRRMGFSVCEGYGLTETAPVLTANPLSRSRAGSVGLALPEVELDIRNQNASGVGELWVRCPNLMAGYYKNQQATDEAIVDGWFRTGDLCRLDSDGSLYVTGRVKDVIITAAGKNVYPDEIETYYTDLPYVAEMCVLAMPSPDGIGDSIDAVMVLDLDSVADVDRSSVEDEVRRSVVQISERMPSYQRVQNIHFWTTELPKTSTMKVRRSVVAKRLIERERPERMSRPALARDSRNANDGVTRRGNSPNEAWLCDVLSRLTKHSASQILPEANLLLDLGVDSLMKVELLGEIETHFGFQLPDQVAMRVGRVSDLSALIRDRRPANGKARGRGDGRRLTVKRDGNGREEKKRYTGEPTPLPLLPLRWTLRGGIGLFFRSWVRVDTRGLENIPQKGAFVLAANHSSHLDSAALMTAIAPALRSSGRRVYVAGAEDYFFNNRLKAMVFGDLCDTIPFDRSSDGIEGMRRCARVLSRGHPLLVFPEGTRSVTGEIQPFKFGAVVLASEASVPIVPVRIENTYELFPKGHRLVRPGVVRIAFGPCLAPVRVASLRNIDDRYAAYRDLAAKVQHAVESLGRRSSISHVS